jgi:putative transposase
MEEGILVRTYKYKLYNHRKNSLLHHKLNVGGIVWNRLVAIMQRHRRAFYREGVSEIPEIWKSTFEKMRENKRYKGKPFSSYRSYNLLQRIRHGNGRLSFFLKELGTGVLQSICTRVHAAYKLYFTLLKNGRKKINPVKFKKVKTYSSITFKKYGYLFDWHNKTFTAFGKTFSFFDDIKPEGNIKILTLKRDNLSNFYIYVVTDFATEPVERDTRPVVGMDFWVNPLITLSDGSVFEMPLFYKENLEKIRLLSKSLSHKQEAKKKRELEQSEKLPFSGNYQRTKKEYARLYSSIANKRKEHHLALASKLAKQYGTIALPNVPLERLNRIKGLNLNDIAYSLFVSVLEQQCYKTGTKIIKIDTRPKLLKTCHKCGAVFSGKFLRKEWVCSSCGTVHKREYNAAKNIEDEAFLIIKKEAEKAAEIKEIN